MAHHPPLALRLGWQACRLGLLLALASPQPGRTASRPAQLASARLGAAGAPAPAAVASTRNHPSLLPPALHPRSGARYRRKPPAPAVPLHAPQPETPAGADPAGAEREDRFRAYARAATLFYRERRYEDALEAWRRALGEKPGDPYVLNDMGAAYLALNRPLDAAKAYRDALLRRPDDDLILGNLTAVLITLGAAREAEGLIMEYRVRQPPEKEYHPLLLLNLAGALAAQEKDGPAIEYLRQAAARDPILVGAHLADTEFARLRASPGWAEIAAEVEAARPAAQSPTSTLQEERSMK